MTRRRSPILAAAAVAALLASTAQIAAAQVVFVQPATPDADALADEMRLLAANPSDVNAMIRAGELTLKLDDATAAAGFFARAERIDPNNPRIKAGKATLLVRAGRPGEALRLFGEAESLGGDVRRFASDRGLAYDLIGEQERAQRDYRLALQGAPSDETLRRYALSLGISGRRDEALATIDALLRRSDRGAWRARAFILAMNGDATGAERIAASMMPGGMGQGLQPFFDRLPRLSAADRAFAVHFGEVRATPQRIADARMAPRLPSLLPEPGRPATVLAAAAPPQQVGRPDKKAKRDRKKRGQGRIEVATLQPPVPLPQPPAYQGPAAALAASSSAPVYVQPIPQPPMAMASNRLPQIILPARRSEAAPIARALPELYRPATPTPTPTPTPAPVPSYAPARTGTMTGFPVAPPPSPARAAPTPGAADRVASSAANPVQTGPAVTAIDARPRRDWAPTVVSPSATPAPTPVPAEAAPTPVAVAAASPLDPAPPASRALPPVPGPAKGEDSILAKIIANITVPGSELDVAPVTPEPVRTAEAAPAEPRPIAAARVDRDPQHEAMVATQKAADRAANDKKLADAKKAVDKKAADARKLADAKKAEELKKKNDPKLLEPSRIWVQVAGGANEATLPKEWARVRDQAPASFKGKAGWTTPLRATNRVLTGPFKTDTEARGFVNALSKEGVSAFTFTSEAGQKVTKLAGK